MCDTKRIAKRPNAFTTLPLCLTLNASQAERGGATTRGGIVRKGSQIVMLTGRGSNGPAESEQGMADLGGVYADVAPLSRGAATLRAPPRRRKGRGPPK